MGIRLTLDIEKLRTASEIGTMHQEFQEKKFK
jgi:hypothetical protein